LSPDGRWVAFETIRDAASYDPSVTDRNGATDVVLQDVLTGTNVVVSRALSGDQTGSLASFAPVFSPDGRWLAFASRAINLAPVTPGGVRLYVRDLINHVTINASGSPLVGAPNLSQYYDSGAIFSRDSKSLAYTAFIHSIGIFDFVAGTRALVCSNCLNPSINSDGRLVAGVSDTQGYDQRVLLIDRTINRVTVIGTNVSSGLFTPGSATRGPILSGDGRYLVFLAERFDGAPPTSPALYYRDLVRGLTMPVPVGLDTGSGNGPSFVPQIAADGRTLVFTSFASDLVPNDYNQSRDVFAYRLGSPDTDQDGLDDDWEVAYFNTLERNGSGDYDQDGLSDAAEFQAGTDPTNVGSVLSIILLTDLGQNAVIVQWNSVTGRTYDVQYKDALSNEWSTLSAGVPADGPTKSIVDRTEPRPTERFYRVVLSP
jgi:hypothetical protein